MSAIKIKSRKPKPALFKTQTVNLNDISPVESEVKHRYTGYYNRYGFAVMDENSRVVFMGGNSQTCPTWYAIQLSRYAMPLHMIHTRCHQATQAIANQNGGSVWDITTFEYPFAPGADQK